LTVISKFLTLTISSTAATAIVEKHKITAAIVLLSYKPREID